jgi:hypothetical protein
MAPPCSTVRNPKTPWKYALWNAYGGPAWVVRTSKSPLEKTRSGTWADQPGSREPPNYLKNARSGIEFHEGSQWVALVRAVVVGSIVIIIIITSSSSSASVTNIVSRSIIIKHQLHISSAITVVIGEGRGLVRRQFGNDEQFFFSLQLEGDQGHNDVPLKAYPRANTAAPACDHTHASVVAIRTAVSGDNIL